MKTADLRARHGDMVANLLNVYDQATDAERAAGADWYPRAYALASEWAARGNLDVRTVAAVIAALSPQTEWTRNLIAADEVLTGQHFISHGPLPINVEKARRVLADRATTTQPYFKAAPKVANFERNIAGNLGFVTVDAHAMQAALNDLSVTAVRANQYALVAAAYREAAEVAGVEPAVLQAIVWVTWKRLYTPATKRQFIKRGQTS